MFNLDGVNIEFDNNALHEIAKKALLLKSGARALRTILEESMLELMYKTPSDKSIKAILIDEKCITGLNPPQIIKEDKVSVNA